MILVNASNLHQGGGVQAATSLISEMIKAGQWSQEVTFWVSSEVDAGVRSVVGPKGVPKNYSVIDSFGINFIFSKHSRLLDQFEIVLTIFGPLYTLRNNFISVTGFAQAWIAYPDNAAFKKLSWTSKIKSRFKFGIQRFFFNRSDFLVVEAEHVREALDSIGLKAREKVFVISNSVSHVFLDFKNLSPVSFPVDKSKVNLGFVGKNYPHKNTEIFPKIIECLRDDFKLDVDIWVTFDDSEWASCSDEFRASVKNVGMLKGQQLPGFYSALDGVIFPSLLECFSVTPLEAMVMKKPLFLSDTPFNRDVCGDFGFYFDPQSASRAAREIARGLGELDAQVLDRAREHALSFPGPNERASQYFRVLDPIALQKAI